MKFHKNKIVWSFLTGALFATKGVELVTSEKAKNIYAKLLANGMIATDSVKTYYEDVKEEAVDIREEAKSIKAKKLLETVDE